MLDLSTVWRNLKGNGAIAEILAFRWTGPLRPRVQYARIRLDHDLAILDFANQRLI